MNNVYKSLLLPARLRASSVPGREIFLEAESDRGRLLFCPAFRRLQQKAQVFSLESNAAVRSRLTHSFEVSQIGRYLADKIIIKLQEKGWADAEQCSALVTFVETACLMHDIGNPPFGHFGEAAISEWFRHNGESKLRKSLGEVGESLEDSDVSQVLSDFLEFDGNPQGLRVVARLQRNSDEYGLNLTKTTIASYLKYVRGSADSKGQHPHLKKCGYFSTEEDIVRGVWSEFGYAKAQRFPLAYIMEAADDIAYCVSDIEDSIEKGLLIKKKAIKDIQEAWLDSLDSKDAGVSKEINDLLDWAAAGSKNDGTPFTFIDFRTSLNRILVECAAGQYIDSHEEVLSGRLEALIGENSPQGKILKEMKSYCRSEVYCHESVHRVELAGYRAIFGLLDHFSCLLEIDRDRFECAFINKRNDSKSRPIIVESKILSLFPKNYKASYDDRVKDLSGDDKGRALGEWKLRAHLVVDYVSGMTDDYAISEYQNLSGIKI